MAKPKSAGIVNKLIEGMPQSATWETVKEIMPGIYSCDKMHTATIIQSRPQAANETLQQYIQRFTDLLIYITGTEPTAVTCQVSIGLFTRHLLNKEIKKQVAGAKTTKTLRHSMTLSQQTEIKLKSYE